MLILRKRGLQLSAKPDGGFNFGHPLARGCLIYSPINELTGKRLENLARPCFPGTYVNVGGTEALVHANVGRWGHSINTTDNGQAEYFNYGSPADNSFQAPDGITVMVVTTRFGDQFTRHRAATKNTANTDGGTEWELGNGTSNTLWRWRVQTSGGLRTSEFTGDALVHMVTGTYDGVTQKLYEDTVLKDSDVRTEALVVSTGNVQLMGHAFGSNTNWRNPIYLFGYWNRALSADEIRWLYQEPYDLMMAPRRLLVPSTGVAPPAGDVVFRRTLSQYGTRAGARQVMQ